MTKKKQVATFLCFCLCGAFLLTGCVSQNTPENNSNEFESPYDNQMGFQSWTPESIKETFPKVEKRGTFIIRSHSNHLPRFKDNCQLAGCHPNAEPGMEENDIPPMPESCYICHHRENKLPLEYISQQKKSSGR